MKRTIVVWALGAAAVLTGAIVVGHASELASSRGAIDLRHHEVRISVRGEPHADIRRNGDLVIGGHPITLSAPQRLLTLRYYREAHSLASAGMTVGKAGGWLALKVVGSMFSALWHDDSAIIDHTAHTQAERLKKRVEALCTQVSALKSSQDQLASAQPAFAPYAYIRKSDVSKCFRDARNSDH